MYNHRNSLSLVLYGGYLFALGGSNGIMRLNSVEKYDFNTGNWSLAKPMRCSRSTFSACILEDKLYVVGGHNHHTQLKSVEYYDLQTDKWHEVKSLKKTRSGFAICTYKSFKLSRKFTYTHYAEQQLIKSKKSHFKLKSIKVNEQSINQSNNRINRPLKENSLSNINHFFNGANANRFRLRRNQQRPNSSFSAQYNAFGTRSLSELNRSNETNPNASNARRSQSNNSVFNNTSQINRNITFANGSNRNRENNQESNSQQASNLTDNSVNNNRSDVHASVRANERNIQISDFRNQENQEDPNRSADQAASTSSNRHSIDQDSSSFNEQASSLRVKSYPIMNSRIFRTRSLNNERIVDRENDEQSDYD